MDAKNKFLENYKKATGQDKSQASEDKVPEDKGLLDQLDAEKTYEEAESKDELADIKETNLKEDNDIKEAPIGETPLDGNLDKEEQKSAAALRGFMKPRETGGELVALPPKNKNKFLYYGIAGLLLVLLVIGLFLFFNKGIEMMYLVGWTENDAHLWARDNSIMLQVDKEFNDEVDAGKVISQELEAGSKVKKGSFVKILVSSGHDLNVLLPLPDIMSMSMEEIESWVEENFMDKVRITTENSDTVPLGRVIRFEINDETVVDEVKRNTPIYIVVSKGLEGEDALLIEVPNFKELGIAESFDFANENGLNLILLEEYDEYIPEGMPISQSIKAEEKIAKGSDITLIISKGKRITVPSFASYTKEQAMAVAGELGIPVTIDERYSSAKADAFIYQSIEAGSEYEKGTTLELVYSIDNRIVLSSFVDQTRDAIELWARELNANGASISINVSSTRSNAPRGTIIYQDKENIVIGTSATINITVSEGRVIYVPDFVAPKGSDYSQAITREKAIEICEELNIVPIFKEAANKDRLPGEIWGQSIDAGREITEGTTITLSYVPANVNVDMPNFKGMTRGEVASGDYLKKLNIVYIDPAEYVEGFEGKVYDQSHMANTRLAAGTTISLYIGADDDFNLEPDLDSDSDMDDDTDDLNNIDD